MASRREFKKDIDYLVTDVISNCYSCLYFNPDKSRDEIISIIEEAVDLRNKLISKVNPAEKHNRSLVKKHFAALSAELFAEVDNLFEKLSTACKGK